MENATVNISDAFCLIFDNLCHIYINQTGRLYLCGTETNMLPTADIT